jgi:hypothetical protein
MAARKKEKQKGYGKLLDAWVPPADSGMAIGCLATSFTFSSAFFEEECLSRFLTLETDAADDGPLYLIEREEKLAQLMCACAVVDQHHCQGPRSLRWDLLPARVPRGILHAKVSLLVWSNLTRIVIASANLTEDGYRRNLEVFGIFDYREGGDHPIRLLRDTTSFLIVCADRTQTQEAEVSPPLERVRALLDRVANLPSTWGRPDDENLRDGANARAILVGPDTRNVFESLTDLWPAGNPPSAASVFSPFFDPPDAPNAPAHALWQCLRKRGEATVSFFVEAEETRDGKVLAHAPESLLKAQPMGRPSVATHVHKIEIDSPRPFHAKGISLEDDRWRVYMIGSSNFTTAGLGVGSVRNLEANVAFVVDRKKQQRLAETLEAAFPEGVRLDIEKLCWEGSGENIDEQSPDEIALPEAFGPAIYTVNEREDAFVYLTFAGKPKPGWTVVSENDDEAIVTHETWLQYGSPSTLEIEWKPVRPPSGFWVGWKEAPGRAWWPVNVESTRSLPPPDELKSLPLEVLIEILTSARPLHRVLSEYLNRRDGNGGLPGPIILVDPHKRVDTSQFLLQRTRRVSWALSALREKLQRPVATEEGLRWRLYGPVGVKALATALVKEGHSEEEKAFLLSELVLELSRVRPTTFPGYLPVERMREGIRELIAEQRETFAVDLTAAAPNLRSYVETVFDTVLK